MTATFTYWINSLLRLRMVKFIITGGSALAIDILVYFMLTRFGHVHYLISRTTSLIGAIAWNFTLNRRWTFEAVQGNVVQQTARFLIVIIATSFLNIVVMHVGVMMFHVYDVLMIALMLPITTVLNFSAHYLWSYAQK